MMEKKDVVFIIVDSLCQHNVGVGFSGVSVTPFLDTIKNECITCTKAYSQGPYTEAGTKSLLCGEDTLASGGYLLRYANSDTFITDVFYDNDYETFCYAYPTALLSLGTIKKTDHMIYTSGFDFVTIWRQKLLYYAKRKEQGHFDGYDLEMCKKVVGLTLGSWDAFLNPQYPQEAYHIIEDCINEYDLNKNRALLQKQIDLFEENDEKYVNLLLDEGESHPLFQIDKLDLSKLIDKETVSQAFAQNPTLESKYKKSQLRFNRKNNKYSLKDGLKDFLRFLRTRSKYELGKLYNYISLQKEAGAMKLCRTRNDYKSLCSAKIIMDDVKRVLTKKSAKPKFVFVHLEDTHYFSTFFSYDCKKVEQIEKELSDAEEYLDRISSEYRGNLMYDLSIRYVDKQIGKLFSAVKEKGNDKNTIICITADHGYSYNRFPLRERLVNNFHEENYHTPVFIYAGKDQRMEYPYFMLGKDIVATLYDLCGFDIPKGITGRSILNSDNKRNYIITEYMGPGCPDIRNREVWFSARNEKRMIAVKAGLTLQSLLKDKIIEAYDLEKDPLEEHPLKSLDSECLKLFDHIVERWWEIKMENDL